MIHSERESCVNKDSKRSLDSLSFSSKPLKVSRAEDREDEVAAETEEKVRGEGTIISSGNRSQRYLVSIEYIGTRFLGSQKQPNFRTVVGCLEVNIASLDFFLKYEIMNVKDCVFFCPVVEKVRYFDVCDVIFFSLF